MTILAFTPKVPEAVTHEPLPSANQKITKLSLGKKTTLFGKFDQNLREVGVKSTISLLSLRGILLLLIGTYWSDPLYAASLNTALHL